MSAAWEARSRAAFLRWEAAMDALPATSACLAPFAKACEGGDDPLEALRAAAMALAAAAAQRAAAGERLAEERYLLLGEFEAARARREKEREEAHLRECAEYGALARGAP